MCRARDDQDDAAGAAVIPDYRERLAYGTDQGKWLMQQVASDATAKQKRRPAARVFHEVDLNIPQAEGSTKKKQVGALAVRQGAIDAGKDKGLLASKSMQKLLQEPMVVAPAVLLFLIALWLLLLR